MQKIISLFKDLFIKDRGILITSFFIAVAVWFYVVGIYSPETAKLIKDVPLIATLTKSTALAENTNAVDQVLHENYMLLKGVPATVDVVVDGLRTDLGTLNSDSIKAEIDFSTITGAGEYNLPVKVKLPAQYTLVSVNPNSINVKIAKQVTVGIEVEALTVGKVGDGYALESIKAAPTIINVTGPEGLLKTIDKAVARIDISNANDVVNRKVDFTLIGKNGEEVDTTNITTDVTQVAVTANIFKSKIIPFSVSVINSSGGSDDKFSTVTISPKEIEVVGSSVAIDSLNSIDLGVVDMAEATTKGKTFSIEIVIPNGVKALTPVTKATITVAYPELKTKTIRVTNFDFLGANGIKASLPNGYTISANIRGVATDLDALDEQMVRGAITIPDVTATGRTSLPLTFSLPSDSKTSVVGKYNILVTIK